ncbi:hypothetical protein L3X38_017629 [Prunus dulcis]|uniref:Reverse transcriptase domain-containing protein n=1 Tax=Prunus dulcis TaxID=3755 RepID=A0AAD4W7M3_PRUDU|nr:hypothetical protein L3X38_017629 [Prunus dulcis]
MRFSEIVYRSLSWYFFDDILIYSTSWSDHLRHLHTVLEILKHHQIFVKMSKCAFGVSTIEYLGHIISRQGVSADPSKLNAIADWPVPTSVKSLKGFLGLTGYYRKFIPHYDRESFPLTQLTMNDGFCVDSRGYYCLSQTQGTHVISQGSRLAGFYKTFYH